MLENLNEVKATPYTDPSLIKALVVDERNRKIIELRRQGLTLDAIGKRYGLTRERVRQICSAARKRGADLSPLPAETHPADGV